MLKEEKRATDDGVQGRRDVEEVNSSDLEGEMILIKIVWPRLLIFH